MKRLMGLVLMLIVVVGASGCQCGRFWRRGARCDVPSFRFPAIRRPAATPIMPGPAPCSPGCNTGGGWTGPGVTYDTNPPYSGEIVSSPGITTSPIEGVPVESPTVEGSQRPVYPVYTEKSVIPGDVVEGPEFGAIPTAP
jgi:hypothetical protein